MKTFNTLFFVVSLISMNALADLDKASQEALDKTTELLRDSKKRQEAMKGKPEYEQVDKTVNNLTQGDAAKNDKMFEIAAKAMETLTKEANGDPIKMQEIMAKAQGNPEQFLKNLPAAQQQQIRALANDIEAQQKQGVKPASPK